MAVDHAHKIGRKSFRPNFPETAEPPDVSRLIVSQGKPPATHPGTTEMKRVTMTDINAYLDGALDERERAEFESVVESDPGAKALLALHRQHVEELHRLYDPVLNEEVPHRMIELLRKRNG